MRLWRLKLENFRQHVNTEIEFEDGMTAIVGANGSGKSTILESIGFALYAESRSNKDQIPSLWQESKKFQVTLEFELNEKHYRVFRTESKAGLFEYVSNDWEERAEGSVSVTKTIIKLLGLTFEQFKNSFCAMQKELEFLKMNRADRRDEMARMLGLEDIKKAEEKSKSYVASLKSELTGMSSLAPTDPSTLVLERDEKLKQISEIEQRVDFAQKKIEQVARDLGPAKKRSNDAAKYTLHLQTLAGLREAGKSLRFQRDQVQKEFEIRQVEAKEHEALQPQVKRFGELEQLVKGHELARDTSQKTIASLELLRAKLDEIDKKLSESPVISLKDSEASLRKLLDEKQKHETQVRDQREAVGLLQERASKARAEALAQTQKLKRSQELLAAGKCPECGQPFAGDFLTRLDSERIQLDQLLEIAQAEEEKLNVAKSALISLEEVSFDALIRATELEIGAAQTRADLLEEKAAKEQQASSFGNQTVFNEAAYFRDRDELAQLRPSYEASLQLAQAPKRLDETQKQLKELTERFDKAKSEAKQLEALITELGFANEQDASEAISRTAAMETDERNFTNQLSDLKKDLQRAQDDRVRTEKRIAELQNNEKKKKELSKQLALYAEAQKQFKLLRESLNRQLQPLIKERAERILSDLTGGRYTTLEVDEKFDAYIVEDGRSKSVISGGEEDVLALSLRLALSQLIQDRQGREVGLLILDEVFGSLDQDRRENVLECLENLKGMTGSFRQIIAISHIEEINEIADQCLYLHFDPVNHTTAVSDQPQITEDKALPEMVRELTSAEDGLNEGLFA